MTRGEISKLRTYPDVALLLLRLIIGVVGFYHGSQKLFGWFGGGGLTGFAEALQKMGVPAPTLGAWLAALAEFAGGILVALGIFPRIAALPFAVNMIVAVTVVHRSAFNVGKGGMEYALTLLVVLLAIVLAGGGRYTVPELVRRSSSGPAQASRR